MAVLTDDSEIKRCSSWSLLQPTVNYNTRMQFCREGIFSSPFWVSLLGQNFCVPFGDGYGMLKMGGVAAISRYDGPMIVESARFILPHPPNTKRFHADYRLNGDDHTGS